MAYGSYLFGLGDRARQRGFAGSESGLERLMAASQQASAQAHARRENEKQREFQDEQRKKQEKAQKKAMWTSLGINAGAGAAGGAATGALAAAQAPITASPIINAAPEFGPQLPPAGYGEGLGVAAPVASNISQIAAPTYTPFAGGSVGGGALAGGALGALGGLSGQNYLGTALAMPGKNYALASNAINDANNTALQWTRFGLDQQRAKDTAEYRDRMAAAAETRANRPTTFGEIYDSLPPELRPAFVQVKGGIKPNANTVLSNETKLTTNAATNKTRAETNAATNASRENINATKLPFLSGSLAEKIRANKEKERLQAQRNATYERGYGSGNGQGMIPNISATPDPTLPGGYKFSGSSKNPIALIQGIDNARIAAGQGPADAYANAEWRLGNSFREGKSQEEALMQAEWMGTDEAAAELGRKLTPEEVARLKKKIMGE